MVRHAMQSAGHVFVPTVTLETGTVGYFSHVYIVHSVISEQIFTDKVSVAQLCHSSVTTDEANHSSG